ncbi:MAG: class I SAM-dependent methyltransferase [Dehalococcoidales bacterium]|nr:class I SAM-dependent methyltransferase [Dehalococcoidales bacterium]
MSDIIDANKRMWEKLHGDGYVGYSWNARAEEILSRLPEGWLQPDMRILEIGAGSGHFMKAMAPYVGEMHGCDISREAVKLAWRLLADIPNTYPTVCDGVSLPYPDKWFNIVYEFAVFQHLPRTFTLSYLRETRRVLKLGGLLFAQFITRRDPAGNMGDIERPSAEETIGWDAPQLRRLVEDSGLHLVSLTDNADTMPHPQVYWSFILAEPPEAQ